MADPIGRVFTYTDSTGHGEGGRATSRLSVLRMRIRSSRSTCHDARLVSGMVPSILAGRDERAVYTLASCTDNRRADALDDLVGRAFRVDPQVGPGVGRVALGEQARHRGGVAEQRP